MTVLKESELPSVPVEGAVSVAVGATLSTMNVLLDELTYMVAYDYLPLESVLSALRERPAHQSVIITGRGCHRDIIELADTVSELRPVKHAFDAGIKAQMGIDY